jgi:hypothetical protein
VTAQDVYGKGYLSVCCDSGATWEACQLAKLRLVADEINYPLEFGRVQRHEAITLAQHNITVFAALGGRGGAKAGADKDRVVVHSPAYSVNAVPNAIAWERGSDRSTVPVPVTTRTRMFLPRRLKSRARRGTVSCD